MNGQILVKDIQVRKNRLKLDGKRVILVLGNTSNDQLTPLITGKSMQVIVEDITEATTQQQIYEILTRIFTTDKVEDRFTNYWRPLIDLNMAFGEIKKSRPDGLIGALNESRPVYCVVRPPKPLHTPDPIYPEIISVLISVKFSFSLY